MIKKENEKDSSNKDKYRVGTDKKTNEENLSFLSLFFSTFF